MKTDELAQKKDRVLQILKKHGSVVVALSGGVDSAVLLSLAVEALGHDRVLAVTAFSPSIAAEDLADARDTAARLACRHEVVTTREFERPGYRANAGDRCYHCRSELFEVLGTLATARKLAAVAYGAIADDMDDFRPGMRAADEAGAIAPLLEAGIRKADVRLLAAAAGLPCHDKPANACLSSRIPIGTEVTQERLAQIGQAESALRALGFGQLRVRHHGEVARLELDRRDADRLSADPVLRSRAVDAVRAAGFRYVTMDLEGYRAGSLNDAPLHRIGPALPRGQ